MFNSKMYKKYYPIKSSFDIANMNVAEQKKLIYWIKSLSEDIRLHNTNSLKKAMQYRDCLLYTSPSPRDLSTSRMPSSA